MLALKVETRAVRPDRRSNQPALRRALAPICNVDAQLGQLVRQCDAQDGLADGIIANVEACRSFDADALTCAPGESEGCIAPDRVEAMKGGTAGYRDATGRALYVPYPWDTGITYSGPGLPGFLPVGQPSPFGPASTAREIDIDERIHQVRWDAAGRLTDTAYWTNLSTFLDRDGKMIIDNVTFDSAAQKAGLDWDQEIVNVLRVADQPSKYWMFIPALLLLGGVVMLQRRRSGGDGGTPQLEPAHT